MDRKYNVRLDLQFRRNNSVMEFDEFDKNTSDFFIRVTKGNKLIDISKAIVTLVAIKPDNSVDAQFVEIRDNNVYCDLKPSMKDITGKYEAIASITVNGETVNTDTIAYEVTENKFLRQLNNEVVAEERFTILTDMINRLSTIELQENSRIDAETNRVEAEKQREIVKEKLISDMKKLVVDTNKKIDDYKSEKDTAINLDLQQYKTDTTQDIDNYKNLKDAEIDEQMNRLDANEDIRINQEKARIKSEDARVVSEKNRVEEFEVIKEDYNTYKNVMISESNVAALQKNINDNSSQIKEKANINRMDGFINVDIQPPARKDHSGFFFDGFGGVANDYYAIFDELMNKFPGYVKKRTLGKDQSGTYNINEYTYTPKNYKKTIFITTGTHGSEVVPILAMYRFLKLLCEDYNKYPQLCYLRENVRIIHIPCANPWGTSQAPKTRQNSSGVDLNRNWDYNWDLYTPQYNEPFGHDYKGTSAFSEKETQLIKGAIELYKKDLDAIFDFHNTGTTNYDFYVDLPENYNLESKYYKIIESCIENFKQYCITDESNINYKCDQKNHPSMMNYCYENINKSIQVANVEYCDKHFGGTVVYDALEITMATNWISSIILKTAQYVKDDDMFNNKFYSYSYNGSTSLTFNSTSWSKIISLESEINDNKNGVVTMNGFIIIIPSVAGIVYVRPYIITDVYDYSMGMYGSNFESYTQVEANKRYVIPFTFSANTGFTKNIKIGITCKSSTAGDVQIYRYRNNVDIIKSNNHERIKINI